MKDWLGEFFIALGVGKTILMGVGAAVGTTMALLASTTTFNSCVDRRIIQAVDPRLKPMADMVEFSLKKQGYWYEYQQQVKDRDCDERIKRGEECKGGGWRERHSPSAYPDSSIR